MEEKNYKIYKIKGILEQNTYIIELNNSCVVIDAGCSVALIKKKCSKPIAGILITHGHFDHINNIEEFKDITVYGSKYLSETIKNPNFNASAYFGENKKYIINNLIPVKDGDIIKFDTYEIKCFATPGHTKDSMCYLFDSILFSGDTLFFQDIGRTDLLGSSPDEMRKSLEKIKLIKYNKLMPGHD